MGFFEFLKTDFWHAAPVLLAGAVAIAIMIERAQTLFFLYTMPNAKGFFEKLSELVLSGKNADAVSLCDSFQDKPLARVVKSALIRAHLPDNIIEHGLEAAVGEAREHIMKRTAFLATIANVATLMGLFGTILGLIASFAAVGHADAQQKSTLLAQGIATAMNATMLGLGVAIPSMVAFSWLMNRSNRLVAEIENYAIRTLELLKQRFYVAETGIHATEETVNNGNGVAQPSDPAKVVPFRRSA